MSKTLFASAVSLNVNYGYRYFWKNVYILLSHHGIYPAEMPILNTHIVVKVNSSIFETHWIWQAFSIIGPSWIGFSFFLGE